jgi:hypothetical protein
VVTAGKEWVFSRHSASPLRYFSVTVGNSAKRLKGTGCALMPDGKRSQVFRPKGDKNPDEKGDRKTGAELGDERFLQAVDDCFPKRRKLD